MAIRIVRGWRRFKPGDVVDLGDPVNDVLVRRGIAEIEQPPKPKREQAVRRNRGANAMVHAEAAR